ncbi:type II toxin-antitoxin system VapC family toxin [Prauserella muralis]|uniref:Ribonuclease VapC n=1 Tax=Prauserella muralis TaxID=588067 RepID=A0A2V4BEQ6_9PSEU|nr:type II toxin-antitoxin system VapC family toxin [Prauserella muralis]PXY28099.1 ribonuclease [Prauserella muralis]TWE22100.1 hypothetical protein FHX69_3333 [Prauserella muralis]
MKLVDANVLLYAVNSDAPQHEVARDWLDGALSGDDTVGFSWTVLLAFVRLATHPSIFARPLPPGTAFDIVDAWLGQPSAVVVEPTRRHAPLLRGLLGAGTAGNLVNDAHLAALAIEHRAEVVSFDADFTRFADIRLHKLS